MHQDGKIRDHHVFACFWYRFCLFLLRAFGIDFASFYCVLLVSILPLSIACFWYRFCLFLLRAFGIDFASFYCVLLVSILPLSIACFWYRFCLFLLRAFGIDFASFYDSLLDFRTAPKVLYFLFLILFLISIKYQNR